MLTESRDTAAVTLDEVLRIEGVVRRRRLPHGMSAKVIVLSAEEVTILEAIIDEAKARLHG